MKLATSKKDSKRLISSGGTWIGGVNITNKLAALATSDFEGVNEVILKVGKKRSGVMKFKWKLTQQRKSITLVESIYQISRWLIFIAFVCMCVCAYDVSILCSFSSEKLNKFDTCFKLFLTIERFFSNTILEYTCKEDVDFMNMDHLCYSRRKKS